MALPEDIIQTEILPRLPMKFLIRSRSVCKLWYSLLSDANIIKCCTPLDPNEDYLILNKVYGGSALSTYQPYDDRDCGISLLSLSSLSESGLYEAPSGILTSLELLGSINGLVCLFLGEPSQFILFNPATRQAKLFNEPIPPMQHKIYECYYGFCWDGVEKDYKVVIFYLHDIFPESPAYSYRPYVYSCNSDSWSLLPDLRFNRRIVYNLTPSVIINGTPYWPCYRHCPENFPDVFYSVMKFEVGSNMFKGSPDIDYPASRSTEADFIIFNLKECLHGLVYNLKSLDSLVSIFCVDERYGVWSKMINVGSITGNVDAASPFLKYDEDIVFSARGKPMCYNLKTNKIKDLSITEGYLKNCFSYKASLVFLKGMKPTTTSDKGFMRTNEGDALEDDHL